MKTDAAAQGKTGQFQGQIRMVLDTLGRNEEAHSFGDVFIH